MDTGTNQPVPTNANGTTTGAPKRVRLTRRLPKNDTPPEVFRQREMKRRRRKRATTIRELRRIRRLLKRLGLTPNSGRSQVEAKVLAKRLMGLPDKYIERLGRLARSGHS